MYHKYWISKRLLRFSKILPNMCTLISVSDSLSENNPINSDRAAAIVVVSEFGSFFERIFRVIIPIMKISRLG